ncbi:MAG: nucleoside deaminase [Candidatus Omnitrophica bacterium]|nr:nucleoside deaminase [Candidatus Omnitrophota bacterium]
MTLKIDLREKPGHRMCPEDLMLLAIEEARKGMTAGHGGPFGAVISMEGRIIASAHNTVLGDNDPTRHAEISAISLAARKLGDLDLSGCELYTTTEPCPMCFSAIHWAKISRIVFGTSIEDVRKRGFNELSIPVWTMKDLGGSPVRIEGGFMEPECEKLLEEWDSLPVKRVY